MPMRPIGAGRNLPCSHGLPTLCRFGLKMVLADEAARLIAISAHGRSILVEAGAGSGKTAVMAGRIPV